MPQPDIRAVTLADTTVPADDGYPLAVTTAEPVGPARGAVLLAPAMATPRRFYRPFVTWLAEQGQRVLVLDYRGMESRRALRAQRHASLDRWFADARDALAHHAAATSGLPLTWLGHSVGGQMLPFVDHGLLDRAVVVATGTGYWRSGQVPSRWGAPLLFRGVAPVSTRVAGYYPGERLRILGDLPAGVMRQWARWCSHPGYLDVDHPDGPQRYAAVRTPLTSVAFTDDELMTRASEAMLLDRYTGAPQTRTHFKPAELGVARVGHHGFFRVTHAGAWPAVIGPHLPPPTPSASPVLAAPPP